MKKSTNKSEGSHPAGGYVLSVYMCVFVYEYTSYLKTLGFSFPYSQKIVTVNILFKLIIYLKTI